ncbi:hypothetical protein F511_00465 [Dorcoceras hygrometricum]|uniref:Uncharacterized protein n=1 Tax=Dorcoceras hygrometricum TaxID=472368 RepID=A0A2Z7BI55_9LAMI|nr:hypothetical protein F511_00465 [Dorcoceras hygrometricum]
MVSPSITFPILLLVTLSLTTSRVSATKQAVHPYNGNEIYLQKLAALDAITLSIEELQQLRNFVNLIPKLKNRQMLNLQTLNLLFNVDGLVFEMGDLKSTLHRVRHLKDEHLMFDAYTLRRKMARIVTLGKICSSSLVNNVDLIVLSMLNRKIEDLDMVVDNAVCRVLELKTGQFSG